jgi:hypothetical protein
VTSPAKDSCSRVGRRATLFTETSLGDTMKTKAIVLLAAVLAFASNGVAQSSAYEVAHPGSAPYSPDRGTPTEAAYQGDQAYCPPDNNSSYSNSTYDVPSIEINSASSSPSGSSSPSISSASNDGPSAEFIPSQFMNFDDPLTLGLQQKQGGAQPIPTVSLAAAARALRANKPPLVNGKLVISQDNVGRVVVCNTDGSACRVL